MITRPEIVRIARRWLGTPWRHQGRSIHGIDCAGLLCMVADDIGLRYEDRLGYRRVPESTGFVDHLKAQLIVGSRDAIREGSIAVFRQSAYPCHCGIFSIKHDVLHVIHSVVSHRKVVEEPLEQVESMMTLTAVLEYPGVSD